MAHVIVCWWPFHARRRQTISMPHPKTPLIVTTLDLPEDVKGQHVPAQWLKDRSFRVPHNYQQYQQTILSRSYPTDPCDKAARISESICVLGAKIESQCKPQRSAVTDTPQNNNPVPRNSDPENFQLMNALGETKISFYDFQRTWSIEDYECDNYDDGEASPSRIRRMSLNDAAGNNRRNSLGINRPPSPKTKQIIRVNVVKVANS